MFQDKQVEHLRIRNNNLFIKYWDENEKFLTNSKVDLKSWFKTQGKYYQEARNKTIQKAKGWEKRYQNYCNYLFYHR